MKVADFGFARMKEENSTMTRCGSPCWTGLFCLCLLRVLAFCFLSVSMSLSACEVGRGSSGDRVTNRELRMCLSIFFSFLFVFFSCTQHRKW